ncbi:ANTAR domain-containing protein [Streptomyces violaceusniger]
MGILMERLGVGEDDAFNVLRRVSQGGCPRNAT